MRLCTRLCFDFHTRLRVAGAYLIPSAKAHSDELLLSSMDNFHSNGQNALVPSTDPNWRTIFHASNQVVLYNPTSHALSIRQSTTLPTATKRDTTPCPYCKQDLPVGFVHPSRGTQEFNDDFNELMDFDTEEEPEILSREPNYFHLLAISNQSASRQSTPPRPSSSSSNGHGRSAFSADAMAEGYFKAFFKEEIKLGQGANGSVYLCQVRRAYFRLAPSLTRSI
jgi:hypothetical protein